MELTFSNPLGLLALLGIPLVVAIHFLQRKRVRFVTSTLFLVPERKLQEKKGTRFQFWRNSLTFWTQIVFVLLLAWLLVGPRWVASDWRQQVVLIHDASISMRAFEDERLDAINEIVDSISKLTSRTEWLLLPTDAREGVEFRGMGTSDFLAACKAYVPRAGRHSFEQAYQLAGELNREGKARVILLTDHVPDTLPPSFECYAIGSPIENVGFAGLSVDRSRAEPRWRATVRNYGLEASTITWQMIRDGEVLHQASLELLPRTTQVLTSVFPEEGSGPLELQLDEDDFAPDNRILVYLPEPKRLNYLLSGSEDFVKEIGGAVGLLPSLGSQGDESQVQLVCLEVSKNDVFPLSTSVPFSIQFRAAEIEAALAQGFYTVESHELMEGLNWNALRYQPLDVTYTPDTDDTVLLWHGQLPLIVLSGQRDLLFNFSPVRANALQMPAFIILLNRFLENSVASLPLPLVANFEGNQSLGFEKLLLEPEDVFEYYVGDDEIPNAIRSGQVVRAPVDATRLRAELNGEAIVDGAVFFAETSEADFMDARETNQLADGNKELVENNSEEGFLSSLWLILLGTILILGWHTSAKGN